MVSKFNKKIPSCICIIPKMVRTYVRKTQRGLQYSKQDMANAIADVKHKKMSFHQAHLVYNIPRATLFTHLHGRRGAKSTTGGRSFAIPFEQETKLADGLRCLEKWGFHVSKKEVQEIVSGFIIKNRISTPFKNNVPGQEWLRGFKSRHQLAIKKPQSVEYARKKVCDPFLIYGFFHVLKETLKELELNDKPGQIWNLDETNLTLEPYETKLFDESGARTETTCTTEQRNITVLSTASASGEKVAPLIIFKEKYIWDCWVADEDYCDSVSSSGTPFAESGIFMEFLETTFLKAIGDVRPILLIYDGHKTHINYDVIEFAKANRITILKFPPYSTHLLQPVFKPFYDEVNVGTTAWQQQQFEISKKTFAEIVANIWHKISFDFFQKWFREAGIYPYNGDVVSRDKFDLNSLKRWDDELKNRLARAENAIQLLNEDKHLLMQIMQQQNAPTQPENDYNYVEVSSEFLIKEENDSDSNKDPLAYLQKPGNNAANNFQPPDAYSSDDSMDASSSLNERLSCELNKAEDLKDPNLCGLADTSMLPSNHQRSSLSIRQYAKFGEYIADELSNLPPHVSVVCQKLMNDVLFEAKCGNVDTYSQMAIRRKKKK